MLFLFCPILFLLRIPPCKLPLSFLALEKRLYLREQDMSQDVHFMDRYPGVVVVALLFPRHISAWRTHFSTTRTRRPGIMNTSRKDKGGGFGPRFSVRNPCVNLTFFFGISIQNKEAHNATRNPRNDWKSKKKSRTPCKSRDAGLVEQKRAYTNKSQTNHWCSSGSLLVEAGGVEPPSENASSGTSPGADGHLHSLALA